MVKALKLHFLRFKEALPKNPLTQVPPLTMKNDIKEKFPQSFKTSKIPKKLKI